ncbi:hemolysin XhlA family protein [Salsuginibacillus kocurii]|uniref:hemolysin XhlA family protein n=1 Tax=Salsuginibacillus kocurii TaxID=427078 RepID=UPI000360814F|nr:hemolysin XhlA family protein [Salsuginibacillus kocurii]
MTTENHNHSDSYRISRNEQEIERVKEDVKGLEQDVRTVETRTTLSEQKIKNVEKDIQSIHSNTTWILRLIVGTIVAALLGLIFI